MTVSRIERPFRNGTLVVRISNGKRDVLFIDQWHEVTRPMWDLGIAKAVAEMTEDPTV
jgi:hypothetical protein